MGVLEGENIEPEQEPAAQPEQQPAPPEAEWQGVGRDDWQRVNQFVETASPVLEQLGQWFQQQEPEPEPAADEWADLADPAQFRTMVQQEIQTALQQQRAMDEAERQVAATIDRTQKELGTSFDAKIVRSLAAGLIGEVGDANRAIRQAAETLKNLSSSTATQAVTEEREHLRALSEAPEQPPAGGAAVEVRPMPRDEVAWMKERFSA